MNARVVAIYNRKGGTGKTTLTLAAAGAAAMTGGRVVLLDADPAQDCVRTASGWEGVTVAPWEKGWQRNGIAKDARLVLIDCPPVDPTPPAVKDADLIVVPVNPEALAVARLIDLLKEPEFRRSPWAVVINEFYRGKDTQDAVDDLKRTLGDRLWLPPIPRRTAFPRAQEAYQPVQDFKGRPREVVNATAGLVVQMMTWSPA